MPNKEASEMTKEQFKAMLVKAGFDKTEAAAKPLGISIRQAFRYAEGEQEIPVMPARLLEMFATHGVPRKWR